MEIINKFDMHVVWKSTLVVRALSRVLLQSGTMAN